MSMKSFDKFCERLILAELGSEKEVFDERQRVIQQRLAVEALLIYGGVTLINTMMMEIFYQWAESWMAATFLFVVLCLLWWQIRCAVKGCMAPVSGKYIHKGYCGNGNYYGCVKRAAVSQRYRRGELFCCLRQALGGFYVYGIRFAVGRLRKIYAVR